MRARPFAPAILSLAIQGFLPFASGCLSSPPAASGAGQVEPSPRSGIPNEPHAPGQPVLEGRLLFLGAEIHSTSSAPMASLSFQNVSEYPLVCALEVRFHDDEGHEWRRGETPTLRVDLRPHQERRFAVLLPHPAATRVSVRVSP